MKRKAVHRLTSRWIKKLGIPEGQLKVAVGSKEWRETGETGSIGHYYGCVMRRNIGFAIANYQKQERPHIANTIVHEIAHILWPNKPHWWVECFAQKVAPKEGLKEARRLASLGYGNAYAGRYSRRYAHEIDELPGRAKCIGMARKRARGLYRKDDESPTAS